MDEIILPIEDELVEQLRDIIRAAEPARGTLPSGFIVFIVDRTKGLKIEIRINEHPPPHFHVTGDGEDASFSILHGTRLPGVTGLERWDAHILKWWTINRFMLVQRWNASRPSNCAVGPIVL